MEQNKLVIFDLDGTVLDTLEDLTAATNYALGQNGLPPRTLEEVRAMVGNGAEKQIERAVPAGTDSATIARVLADYLPYYQEHCAEQTRPYGEICNLLKKLKERGVHTAVVSNKPDASVQTLVERYFPSLFDFALGAKEGMEKKPAPDGIRFLLDQFDLRKEDAVYVGDSETDMKTAENAQMRAVAVLWGFRNRAQLKNAHATRFAATVGELESFLNTLLFDCEKKFNLLFLGTGAASKRLPAEYTDKFDTRMRRNSCALLNKNMMIDCGPMALSSLAILDKNLAEITDIFFTHLHGDHFNADAVTAIAAAKEKPLRIWVREDANFPEIANTEIHRMTDRTPYQTDCGFTVTGLRSNHDQSVAPQYLLFERDERRMLYATDGAWMLFETFYYLRNRFLDLLVWDCTVGDYVGDFRMAEHNSLPMIRMMIPSLESIGVIDKHTEIYLQHMSLGLHKMPHEQTVALAAKDGLKVAYDGLEISC